MEGWNVCGWVFLTHDWLLKFFYFGMVFIQFTCQTPIFEFLVLNRELTQEVDWVTLDSSFPNPTSGGSGGICGSDLKPPFLEELPLCDANPYKRQSLLSSVSYW